MFNAAVTPAGDGAAIVDILLVGAIISAVTIAVLAAVDRYRRTGGGPLRAADVLSERVMRVPGWAAAPSLGTIVAAVITFMAAIWDISVHIDEGRDSGPFGTAAHYPLLIGLICVYLVGIIAVGMAPSRDRHRVASAIEVPGYGPVPVGALLILGGGTFAILAFPLDDLWHRIFGQDVTLWGPTHTMFFSGLMAASMGAVILRAEGIRASGREPFGRWGLWRRPLPGVLGGIFLFVGAHICDEFNWAVPQYREVWYPMLLALFGAFGLIAARVLGGRGATIAVLAAYLPLQFAEVTMIGALGNTMPASPLYIVEAAIVELTLWRMVGGVSVGRAALAGLGVGTIGFAAEYAWTQIAMPIELRPAILVEALPSAAIAAVAGAVLAVLLAQALIGSLPAGRRPLALAGVSAIAILVLAVNASITTTPSDATAMLALSNVRQAAVEGGQTTRVADLRVTLSEPALAQDANWVYVLGWQGGGRHAADLVRQADGSLLSSRPVPIGDRWKTIVRVHKGRDMVATPIRMPADPGIGYAGVPAETSVTRELVRDTELMQLELKDDAPTWAWTPAMIVVMLFNLLLMLLIAAAAVRSGRTAGRASVQRVRSEPLTELAERPVGMASRS